MWSTLLILLLALVSCVQDQAAPASSATPTPNLIPYSSPTASPVPHVTAPKVLTPTNPPTPTPTPITYRIVAGDTMLAIALRYGISLEELQAANPEVNPRLLSVGTVLVIPLGDSIPSSPVTATPLPIQFKTPNCYTVPDGTWCFLIVNNDRSRPMENISSRIVLYDQDGEMIAEGIAHAALNKVPVSEAIPLTVFFAGTQSGDVTPSANLLTAQFVPKNDDRYLNAWSEIDKVLISDDGMQAEVIGSLGLPKKSSPGNLVWIVATAYNAQGQVVGIRKLEQIELLDPGESREFSLSVYSLGPPIAEVKLLVEARP